MTQTGINDKLLLRTASLWNIDPVKVHRSVEINGSPERSELRFVIEGGDHKRYVIESIHAKDLEIKKNIIIRLEALTSQKLHGINPCLDSANKKTIEHSMGRYWQLSRFVEGYPLKRPEYVFDKWRGTVLADFLIELRAVADVSETVSDRSVFSLKEYIEKLSGEIIQFNPETAVELEPVFSFLEKNFMRNHDRLPVAFCHGDYHSVNVIWSETGIAAVIDWEFCGIKAEIYDAANLLGCLGIEQPEALSGSFALEFIRRLRESKLFSEFSWQNLLSFIVAIRFAWLAEWLRRDDIEMIDLELVYMKILIDNEAQLKKIWKI